MNNVNAKNFLLKKSLESGGLRSEFYYDLYLAANSNSELSPSQQDYISRKTENITKLYQTQELDRPAFNQIHMTLANFVNTCRG